MGIPESQLKTWSNRPDPARSAATYAAVREVLDKSPRLREYGPDVYLQGSYANATNIRSDSDVDVVCQLTESWQPDIARLDPLSQLRYRGAYSSTELTWSRFRSDVLLTLREAFGSAVSEGSKCLKIAGDARRLPADVLVAQEYRLYTRFNNYVDQAYIEGVTFWDRQGRRIVNFPKRHRENGETKHAATKDQYKAIVRTVKNARRRAVDDGLISKAVSPSYFVECLLWNVPNDKYDPSLKLAYIDSILWLGDHVDKFTGMYCQNGVTKLFGRETTQWNVADAERLVLALCKQWVNWK